MTIKPPSLKTLYIIVLVALFLLGLWLRLHFINAIQLYPDEFATLLAIRMIGQKGAPILPSGLFYEHGLLFSYLAYLSTYFGEARLLARYTSLVCGLLTIGLTFWLGKRYFSRSVGTLASIGLIIAPTAIEWSGRARMYALLQLLVLLTLWLFYDGLTHRPSRWLAWLTYLAACLTNFAAVILAPPMLLAGLIFQNPPSKIEWLKSKIPLALILLMAFLVKRLGQPKGVAPLESTGTTNGLVQVLSIYGNFSLNPLDSWQAIAPFYLSLPALIFSLFALWAMLKCFNNLRLSLKECGNSIFACQNRILTLLFTKQTKICPTLYATLILFTTTLEMIFLVSPDRQDDKYLFMLLPMLLLLGAQGMAYVGQASCLSSANRQDACPTSKPYKVWEIIISLLILLLTRPEVEALLAHKDDDYDSAFAYVKAQWREGDTILTGTPAAAYFYLNRNDFYSVQKPGIYDYRLLTINGQTVDRWLGSPVIHTETALQQTLAKYSVWLVLERWGLQGEYYDLPFQQQLLAQTDYITESQGIFILHSKPHPRPLILTPTHHVEAVFGQAMHLFGYTLEASGQPQSLDQFPPGQTARLTLYWQARAPMAHDYTIFVHLRSANKTIAQADHRPLGHIYPTSLWPTGETIRETSELRLPDQLPATQLELWLGLYRLETGERLPLQNDSSGENAFRVE